MTLIKIKIPKRFEDLTVKQFLLLKGGGTSLEILSILSGESLEAIQNSDVNLDPAMNRVDELYKDKPLDLENSKMQPVFIESKEIKIPRRNNWGYTKYGQTSMIKNLIRESEELEFIISEVFAIYAQPIIDGTFDPKRIPEIKSIIDDMPIVKVYPYTVFFLNRLKITRATLIFA